MHTQRTSSKRIRSTRICSPTEASARLGGSPAPQSGSDIICFGVTGRTARQGLPSAATEGGLERYRRSSHRTSWRDRAAPPAGGGCWPDRTPPDVQGTRCESGRPTVGGLNTSDRGISVRSGSSPEETRLRLFRAGKHYSCLERIQGPLPTAGFGHVGRSKAKGDLGSGDRRSRTRNVGPRPGEQSSNRNLPQGDMFDVRPPAPASAAAPRR